jgi:ATP-dependent DNA ligase
VVDGEIVTSNQDGKPSFNLLQNHGSSGVALFYYVFDVMLLAGRDATFEALDHRQDLLQNHILPRLAEPIRYVGELGVFPPDVLQMCQESASTLNDFACYLPA